MFLKSTRQSGSPRFPEGVCVMRDRDALQGLAGGMRQSEEAVRWGTPVDLRLANSLTSLLGFRIEAAIPTIVAHSSHYPLNTNTIIVSNWVRSPSPLFVPDRKPRTRVV
jgi:hypothetical protein